ncbi:MAG: hypothetical protein A2087_07215 [Spirochaetes bacterium GWD1_61_31]|nr:MAG: hypothetical protein A2Y37_08260 [Spirochaetes bacterium GWB1_60_80]OHD34202.1 MAG: hypothetical protein A2004_12485 [Spirochaetes bacterium GWC1_61_12]OHD40130.1 MAG: hypothetical protein A2087_07215 [Spirochaetes bacterium GWD1_61_31]OHD45822.1 MAG: hypothetical protein A2Y35_03895 [Spirochaetes bacterium GWE1_60_18]OHD58365.1 MAG: hypothetical protein A2Y32_06285 [Spirochaetes bacterium GWF1_60_12]HAW86364.1 hypothetical protein [Spirochaetaceae bacterium]
MNKIYAIGETVFDIMIKDGAVREGRVGGSALNCAVSLGRLGLPVALVSELAEDRLAGLILDFLSGAGVDTSLVQRYQGSQSAVALAFLADGQEAEYAFYKQYPVERRLRAIPALSAGDYLLFGSSFSYAAALRPQLCAILAAAKLAGTLVLYDPNIRRHHLPDLTEILPLVRENIASAHLVRASAEDCRYLFGSDDPDQARAAVAAAGCGCFIYTAAGAEVLVYTPTLRKSYPVPSVAVVSTVGAGDSFNAGTLYTLWRHGLTSSRLATCPESFWDEVAANGIRFAAHVCQSFDNYIAENFARELVGR